MISAALNQPTPCHTVRHHIWHVLWNKL